MPESGTITAKGLDIKIERLNLRDGDSIVVTIPTNWPRDSVESFERYFRHYLNSRGLHDIMGPVLPEGIRIEREHGDDEMTDLIRDLIEC